MYSNNDLENPSDKSKAEINAKPPSIELLIPNVSQKFLEHSRKKALETESKSKSKSY